MEGRSLALLLVSLSIAPVRAEERDASPGSAELVWPWDEAGRLWENGAATAGRALGAATWPKTLAEICGDGYASLADFCSVRKDRPLGAAVGAGVYGLDRKPGLGKTFEIFAPGWESKRVDPEQAGAWSAMPSALSADLAYPLSPHAFIRFRMGLRRDLAAWLEDPLALNIPLTAAQIDLNEPSFGYLHAGNDWFAFTIGRFPVHWSPSREFGVTLSRSVPYHNGAAFEVWGKRLRYRFLVSSLNPWLEGTPAGPASSEDYPPGSEEWRQRHYADEGPAVNFRKRVYDARIKTLFAHRVEASLGPLAAGFTELEVIGGKFPDLRDANPFAVFHNDFKDGYVNSGMSLDALLRLPRGVTLAGEVFFDDVRWGGTESDTASPSLLGYLAECRHAFSWRGWRMGQSLDFVLTDPFLYAHKIPLNTFFSRRVVTSNYHGPDGDVLIDKLVTDFPLGYYRGGDAMDFWYRLEALRGASSLSLTLGALAKGVVDAATPYEDLPATSRWAPTGTVEREVRIRVDGSRRLPRGILLQGGLAFSSIENEDHVEGVSDSRWGAALGLSWFLPL